MFTTQGLKISTPTTDLSPPTSYQEWLERGPPEFGCRDRRRFRLFTPIYVFPPTGDPFDDMVAPFLIVYSAEDIGLPPLPAVSSADTGTGIYQLLSTIGSSSELLKRGSNVYTDGIDRSVDCWIPSFAALVRSEIHVLLKHSKLWSPVWCQHMAQLSALSYSRSCPGGPDGLLAIVADEKLANFVRWFQTSRKGEAHVADLNPLQEKYLALTDVSYDACYDESPTASD